MLAGCPGNGLQQRPVTRDTGPAGGGGQRSFRFGEALCIVGVVTHERARELHTTIV